MNQRPAFSIIHPTARPQAWRAAYEKWIGRAADPQNVEYVLAVDERWGFDRSPFEEDPDVSEFQVAAHLRLQEDKLTWNTGRMCIVDNANEGCNVSTGSILVIIADDIEPPENWDRTILDCIAEKQLYLPKIEGTYVPELDRADDDYASRDFVVEVSTGTPSDNRKLMLLPFFSRGRYERVGYGMYPEYMSMFADDDFGEHARVDAAAGLTYIVDATFMKFPHHHPIYEPGVPVDAVYKYQNHPAAYSLGRAILERRRKENFAGPYPYTKQPTADRPRVETPGRVEEPETTDGNNLSVAPAPVHIACILPGEHFSSTWVKGWMELFTHLLLKRNFGVVYIPVYTSIVYETRIIGAETALNNDPKVDYILWIDDDNVLTPANFDRLYQDLQEHPEADGVAAWCWVHWGGQWTISVGNLNTAKASASSLPVEQFATGGPVKRVSFSGFPAFLMRPGAIIKAGGPRAFAPKFVSEFEYSGEDLSFCRRAADGGAVFYADRRVCVPHLKLRVDEPPIPTLPVKTESEEIIDKQGAGMESRQVPSVAPS